MATVVRLPRTKKPAPKPARTTRAPRIALIRQFLIVLHESSPLVWRRIQVPATYSFWDLHVAIQDAMGWEDKHLHEFRLPNPETRDTVTIGIPGDEADQAEHPVTAGWTVAIAPVLDRQEVHAPSMLYAYDFGDGWLHTVIDEGIRPVEARSAYPRCVEGQGHCPPEDCGGPYGYAEFIEAIANKKHPRHKELREWYGRTRHFDPLDFDPASVTFDDPAERWNTAFRS